MIIKNSVIFFFGKFKNPPRHCADTALDLYSTRLQDNWMRFSTKNPACRKTGWHLIVGTGCSKKTGQLSNFAVIGRGDDPDIGPWVCDGF